MRDEQRFQWDNLTLGVCYYPEQWDPSLWREDLGRMQEVGIGTVRIAEFSWNQVEPREGEFTYDFFDRFLDVAEEMNMRVIWGTPTATPPAWLTAKYPEVLNCRRDGAPYRHGMRRHYTYNSPKYRELSARVVEKIAAHYAARPCIVGWQIDNELNCETDEFYSESDAAAFRTFLRERYGTLDALNEAWGTAFWNQTYTDWEEVDVPRLTLQDSTNPHRMLDYRRFISESAISFCRMQCDILRRYVKPGDFITTNGLFSNLDNHRMMDECLDVYTYDSYPNFAYLLDPEPRADGEMRDRMWSLYLTETRSVCPHFGIMEQQSGANGWNTRMEAPAPRPGQMSLWAMQSIAHGADYIGFFRWRTATFGTEMYWHGILDYDNRDNRRLAEVGRVGERMRRMPGVCGADFCASFALVKDYDNEWDARDDVWHARLAASEREIFAAAQKAHTPFDILYINDDTQLAELQRYPVLFYPHALILTERRADLLKTYVEAGGTLVIGARTGQKDVRGHCVMTPMPGLLTNVCASDVREYTFASPAEEAVAMEWDGISVEVGVFHDILEATGENARVLAAYTGSYYAGEPALIETTAGAGRLLHFGGTFTRANAAVFLNYLGLSEPYEARIELPADCELALRERDGHRYFFVLNYRSEARTVTLHTPMADVDDGALVSGEISLAPYGTKVFLEN